MDYTGKESGFEDIKYFVFLKDELHDKARALVLNAQLKTEQENRKKFEAVAKTCGATHMSMDINGNVCNHLTQRNCFISLVSLHWQLRYTS